MRLPQNAASLAMQEEFEYAVIRWIPKSQVSFNMIEDEDFRAIINLPNKKITFISANTLSRRIQQMHPTAERVVIDKFRSFTCVRVVGTA